MSKFLKRRQFVPHKESKSSCQISVRTRFSHAFTLIEMLVSMVVLALIVVAMMALVDSATKLWRDNEGRTDACREARAALVVMARDLRNAVAGTNADFIKFQSPVWRRRHELWKQRVFPGFSSIFGAGH